MNPPRQQSPLAFALNLVGALAIGFSLIVSHSAERPVWVLVLALVADAAWVARGAIALAGVRAGETALLVVAAVAGGLVAAPSDGLSVVPAAIAVLATVGAPRRPVLEGFGLAVVTLALVAAGAVPFGTSVGAVLAMMGGVVLAVFAGLSRRQFRQSEEQAALLQEREREMREEAARVAIARDLHDVLAHSLGGLVIQLDAVEALLEAGDTAAATARVTDARALAASGLSEARRAVAALRDPAGSGAFGMVVEPAAFAAAVDDLLAAHRSLGGVVDLTTHGEPAELTAAQGAALQRALQESLSNARKHAQGEPVRADIDWQSGRVRLTVSNPLSDDVGELAATGGGHGLDGMRERVAALPLGGAATAGVVGDRFTVTVEARLS
ncbi:histidine kinase [Leifsonia sp. PS1209]|uniref:sensor histidine kinase n=1 Tax=Leifsonia sp. PS1209 TaxID=2724914 RepID=UPI001442CFF7|nr:histidine kinase [Leifsonia sp. PS1209]QIZ99702.1 two-component sensor histidine kinase [Leifsonia sp. PS1209]